MRRRNGLFPKKRTYAEIRDDLYNRSEAVKQTLLYKRLVIKAELIREAEEKESVQLSDKYDESRD